MSEAVFGDGIFGAFLSVLGALALVWIVGKFSRVHVRSRRQRNYY